MTAKMSVQIILALLDLDVYINMLIRVLELVDRVNLRFID